jgi:predicted dehydrogenase
MGRDVKQFQWGIFGTGAISAKFIAGLAAGHPAGAAFVASRDLSKAQAFAKGMGIPRAIAGYAEAAAAGGIDAAYIATPPAFHADHALACIEAGIPVLVEKPFASTAPDAERIVAAARANKVFAMEAMWTRFLPAGQALYQSVMAKEAGTARFVTGSFGTSQRPDPANGMFDPKMGGGALAHLGAYPLSLGQWLFGKPLEVHATGVVGPSGVDEDAVFQLRYPGDVLGSFCVSLRSWAPDDFQVFCENGLIGFKGTIVRPFGLEVAIVPPRPPDIAQFGLKASLRQNAVVHALAQRAGRSGRKKGQQRKNFYAGNGYHYEADEVRRCVERGEVESPVMPLSDSLAVAHTADQIRSQIHRRAVEGTK